MFFKRQSPEQIRRIYLSRLKKQIQGVKNEMEFVEILAQFWPLPNMHQKMERLEERFRALTRQYDQYASLQPG